MVIVWGGGDVEETHRASFILHDLSLTHTLSRVPTGVIQTAISVLPDGLHPDRKKEMAGEGERGSEREKDEQ